MKGWRKTLWSTLLSVSLILTGFVISISAETETNPFHKDNFLYTVADGEITITANCGNESVVIVPDAINGLPVTKIGKKAFHRCRSVTRIYLPESIKTLETGAFTWCDHLESIHIPSGITEIGAYVFEHCGFVSLTLPDHITAIGEGAFFNCEKLLKISVPDSVTSIGISAFENCYRLETVTLPDGITEMSNRMFLACYNLRAVTFSDKLTRIGDQAFSGCASLENFVIPDTVTSIGYDAFSGCASLNPIIIPEGVTSLEEYTFSGYDDNTIVIFPGTTDIPDNAFSYWVHIHSNGGCYRETRVNRRFTLWGYEGSRVYELAMENEIPFVTMRDFDEGDRGDVDSDGSVTAADALVALQFSVRLIRNIFATADMDQNYSINAYDALLILQQSVGL